MNLEAARTSILKMHRKSGSGQLRLTGAQEVISDETYETRKREQGKHTLNKSVV